MYNNNNSNNSTSFSSSNSTSFSSTYIEKDGQAVYSATSSHSSQSTTLTIVAQGASELVSVETMGKQDPFLQFSLNHLDAKSYQKTFTHKNGGAQATWNQTFVLPLQGQPDLFIEVMDEETTFAEVIGFAAIPINQVVHAQGASLNGVFDIFSINGKRAGQVHLTLSAQGFPNSAAVHQQQQVVRGQTYVNQEHLKRVKGLRNKSLGTDIAAGLLGGALAVGAGFLGNKIYNDQKHAESERQEQERQREEEENTRRQERENFDHERQEFEERKSSYEQQQQREQQQGHRVQQSHTSYEERNQSENHQSQYNKSHNEKKSNKKHNKKSGSDSGSGSDSDSDSDSDNEKRSKKGHNKKRDNSCDRKSSGREWDPVGTYAAGDRVKYHGHSYVCLQGHSSNPTWKPDVAHSLWESA